MGTSAITISALAATPSIQGNKLSATLVLTGPDTNIPNLQPDAIEFHRSTTNDRATASLAVTGRSVISGTAEVSDDGLVEETTYYYWAKVKNKLGNYGAWFPTGVNSGVAATAKGMSGLLFGGLANGKIVATVGSSALTIAVKTAAGNDPSASDPVFFAFRSATAANGNYQVRAITAALSLVISSGSTLGTSNSTAFRVWVVLFDDAGTLRLGAIVCSTSTAFYTLDEGALRTSTAEGGAGAADSAGTIYTGTAVTSKPFRILGFLTWNSGLATAGTWSAGPDVIQLFGPGVKKPGELVQNIANLTTTESKPAGTWSSLVNVPPNTEGVQILSTDVTPQSAANWLDHDILVYCDSIPGEYITLAMFQDSTVNAIAAAGHRANPFDADAVLPQAQPIRKRMLAATASLTTFKLRIGTFTGAKVCINGMLVNSTNTIVAILGSKTESGHRISEIMG